MLVRGKDLGSALAFHGVERCLLMTGTVRHTRHDDLELNQAVIKLAYSKFQGGIPWKKGKRKLGWEHHVATWEHTWSPRNGWHPHFHGMVFCKRLGVPDLNDPNAKIYGYKARRRDGDGDWAYYGLGTARCSAISQGLSDEASLKDPDGFMRPVSEWAVPASWHDWARSRWIDSVRRAVLALAKNVAPEKSAAWITEKLEHYLPTHDVGLQFERCRTDKVKDYLTKMGLTVDDFRGVRGGDDDGVRRRFKRSGERSLGLEGASLSDVGPRVLSPEARLAHEVADQGYKRGRGDSLTSLQIAWQFALASDDVERLVAAGVSDDSLAAARSSRAEFRQLWQEYCRVTQGLRHMTWSLGARVAFGLVKPDEDGEEGPSDEAIALNKDVEVVDEKQTAKKEPIASIPRCLYSDLARAGADDCVLARAESQPGRPALRGAELVAFAQSLVTSRSPDTPALYLLPDELGQGPVCRRRVPLGPGPKKRRLLPIASAQRGFRFA